MVELHQVRMFGTSSAVSEQRTLITLTGVMGCLGVV